MRSDRPDLRYEAGDTTSDTETPTAERTAGADGPRQTARTDNGEADPGGTPITTREPRVNERIRAREVRLVDPDGGQIGLKSIEEARWLADQLGLDLVEVAPDARPPVVRMMDYGKFKYEQSVKAREARKKQTRTVIKEVQFRPKISSNDFDVKRKRVVRFLGEGDKVKVTMRFRGREVTHPELGREILERLVSDVEDLGVVETFPRMDGRQMTMVLAPVRRPRPAHTDKQDGEAPDAEMPQTEAESAGVDTAEVGAAEVDTTDGEAPEVATAEVEAPAVAAEAVEAAEVEAAEVDTAEVDTAEVETRPDTATPSATAIGADGAEETARTSDGAEPPDDSTGG